ncbi:PcfK-like family protein [Dysgonomonas sp. GY617]|uniref:PcfK-like family protein n=1 Tax=Dysgonomonas sp. GY617 TaxID=2780420 RepID=UPI0018848FD3|nr:PcfK-like family protein [Dysgonomonas sp. GY617]MBF0577193.1 PcfK-like family protein [Dysgonomonas sp. GY617]
MKSTNHFQNTIKAYLDKRAEIDLLFSFRYSLPEKKLEDCITYILNQVQKSGCNGFHDDEIFGMAVHFYDEDNIEIGKLMHNAQIAVNHVVVLTAEEKEQARQDAMQKAQDEAYRKMTQPTKKAKKVALTIQPSLFDF